MPCKQYQKKAKIVVLISEGEKKKKNNSRQILAQGQTKKDILQ